MFLHIIFKKFKLKENKYLMALIYALIYSVFLFIMLLLAQLYLERLDIKTNFIYSIVLGIIMFVVYLIKWEFFFKK